MNVRELVFRGEDQTKLFACGECGGVYSPRAYGDEGARAKAEQCCGPHLCLCGNEIYDRYRIKCTACLFADARAKEIETLRKATVIEPTGHGEAVFCDGAFGDWEDGYSSSVDALIEAYEDEGEPLPAYCHPCTPQYLQLDADIILERAVADMHEDAADQIVDANSVYAFCDEWNKKQTSATWYPDNSRIIILDETRFAELLAVSPTDEETAKGGDA